MKVRFWGVRGSLAKPGPSTVRYGGNTSCVEVCTAGGVRLVIDCGTGGHELGQAIMAEGRPSRGHMLISHTHWDHIQGIPFFAPLFAPDHVWDLYAPQGFGETLRATLAGQMAYAYSPVGPEAFAATVRYTNLVEGRLDIGDVVVRTRYLNHPALTLAFRIEADGATLAYACDHEPHARALATEAGSIEGEDLRHAAFLQDADLVIHDAQYLAPEYAAKAGWGHSTMEYATAIGRKARARRLALTHHDPSRTDDQLDAALARLRRDAAPGGPEIVAAAEGMVIDLPDRAPAPQPPPEAEVRAIREQPVAAPPAVLLAAGAGGRAERIVRALQDEPAELVRVGTGPAALALALATPPGLMVVEDGLDGLPATAVLARLRDGEAAAGRAPTPVVILSGDGDEAGLGAALSGDPALDRWEEPWSEAYARTRLRTWLMRAARQTAAALDALASDPQAP